MEARALESTFGFALICLETLGESLLFLDLNIPSCKKTYWTRAVVEECGLKKPLSYTI